MVIFVLQIFQRNYLPKKNSHLQMWYHLLIPDSRNSVLTTLQCYCINRKYLLHGYILSLLRQTTAWDRHWAGDETMRWVLINVALLCLASYKNLSSLALCCLMDSRSLRITQNAYFSLSTHTKELLLVTFCDDLKSFTDGQTEGQTDVKSKIII